MGSAVVCTPFVGASPNGSVGSVVVVTAVVGASPNGSVGSAVVGAAVVGVSVGSVVVSSVLLAVVSSASQKGGFGGNQEGLNTSIGFVPSHFEKLQMKILNFCSRKSIKVYISSVCLLAE